MDIPRIFNISESAHRIHNPMAPEKLAALGTALRLKAGDRVLDLGSGSGEMLCTWARDYGIVGTGIDMSQLFTEQARLRARELGVAGQVMFIHGGDHRGLENLQTALCWQVIKLFMCYINFRLQFTEKRPHNPSEANKQRPYPIYLFCVV